MVPELEVTHVRVREDLVHGPEAIRLTLTSPRNP
jgi:hypothetical protein